MVLKMCFLVKATAKSFLDRLTRRKECRYFVYLSFEWIWVHGVVCCLVMKLVRGSGAERNIFERRCRTRFLLDRAAVKSLSSVICVLSNDVGCDGGFFFVRCLYGRKTQRILYQARSLVSSRK